MTRALPGPVRLLGLLLAATLWAVNAGAQSDPPQTLTEVRFEGVARFTADDLLRMTGLRVGQSVTRTRLTEAGRLLADSGFFTEVRYRFTTTSAGIAVTYAVREAEWTVPVVFDNFIGISDEALMQAVAAEVPGFDGTAVDGGLVNARIAAALERALAARGLPGQVEASARLDLIHNRTVYAFAVTGTSANMTICALELPGASEAHAKELQSLVRSYIGDWYSRMALGSLADGSLRRYYRGLGYWGVSFEPATAVLDAGCNGVTASIRVTEGVPYAFAGVEWSGVSALPETELGRLLGVRVGVVADDSVLDAGLDRVDAEYEKRGYLLQRHEITPKLDPDTRKATFAIAVTEGPQFRMGTLAMENVPDDAAREIRARWQLQPGQVFDGSYVKSFLRDNIQLLQQRRDRVVLAYDVRLDEAAAVANVTFRPFRN